MSKGQYGKGCSDTKEDLYPIINQQTTAKNIAVGVAVVEGLCISAFAAYRLIMHLKNKKK